MNRLFKFAILGAALALSGCSFSGSVTRDMSTALSAELGFEGALPVQATAADARDWRLSRLVVNVPETLTVSEANSIKPRADIVWREDPLGDRHAQVAAVMEPALQDTLSLMSGRTAVNVEVTVTRFHALTERTRYTFGGEHEIEFILVVTDATSGAVLRGPEAVDVTFRALGGDEALAAERQGIYQRHNIQARLRQWVAEEFAVVPQVAAR